MAQTNKATRRATARKLRPIRPFDVRAAKARDERQQLQRRLREERAIVKLAGELERAVRRADHRLLELGAGLMGRAAVVHRKETADDLAREEARKESDAAQQF